MLAPRKKLWSTPTKVLDVVVNEFLPLSPGDVVVDIGSGDGRALLQMASHWTCLNSSENANTHINQSESNHDHSGSSTNNDDLLLSVSFVGIDINPERVEEARMALQESQKSGEIHPQLSVSFHCANAMEAKHLYEKATVFFLYLIPRGLKLFKPLLLEVLKQRYLEQQSAISKDDDTPKDENQVNKQGTLLRVLTYMSPLPQEEFVKRRNCSVDHQPGAAWPVFLYHLTESSLDKENSNPL